MASFMFLSHLFKTIVISHVGWGGEQNKGATTFTQHTRFENFEGKSKRKSPKRTTDTG